MSKFTKILENADPQLQDNDDMKLLNALHKVCNGLGYNCSLEGSTLTISLTEEEQETQADMISTISAIAQLPDQGMGKQLMSATARKLQMAKRKMADGAEKIADKFLRAASQR
jgi:uncharacterized protein YihD (DUF1040 family)